MAETIEDLSGANGRKSLLKARFTEIVALNFKIDPKILLDRIPGKLELDYFEGETYVSLVAMVLRRVRVWGIPLHVVGGFGEFNLRYYVRRKDVDGFQRGACFLKDYVSSSMAAWILGSLFQADFRRVKMRFDNTGFRSKESSVPKVDYRWKVDDHWNQIRVRGRKKMKNTGPGTKVGFILEHSNEYSSRGGKTFEYRASRPAWTVWDAAQANFNCDVKQLFGEDFVKPLAKRPASVFISSGSDVTIFRPMELT